MSYDATPLKQGWFTILNSRRAHFRAESGRTLCGKFLYVGETAYPDAERDQLAEPACAECKRLREKMLQRVQADALREVKP